MTRPLTDEEKRDHQRSRSNEAIKEAQAVLASPRKGANEKANAERRINRHQALLAQVEFDEAWDKAVQLAEIEELEKAGLLTPELETKRKRLNSYFTSPNAKHTEHGNIIEVARHIIKCKGPLIEHCGTLTHKALIDMLEKSNAASITHKQSGRLVVLKDSALRKILAGWLSEGKRGRPKNEP